MARKTVKIKVPVGSPDKFSKLGNKLKETDAALGAGSPLNNDPNFDRTDFAAKLALGDAKRKESEDLKAKSETLMEEANYAYGLGKGQTVETPGTVLYYVINAKNYMLPVYAKNPEKLSEFGYDVVVGTAKSPTKKVP